MAMVFQDLSADSSNDIAVLAADFKREQLLFDIAAWLCFFGLQVIAGNVQ